jgi:cytosine/adenosine deaminase-related metal-dependent hydrolase
MILLQTDKVFHPRVTYFVTSEAFDKAYRSWYGDRNVIITADKILTRSDKMPLEDHALVVRGRYIVAVGRRDRILRNYSRDPLLRFDQAILLPGLVNVHTHLELPSIPMSHSSRDYATWVLNLLKEKAHLTLASYRSAVRRNVAELIRSGTTTVAEISSHNVSPLILAESGLRAVVYLEVISMRPDPDAATVSPPLPRDTALVSYGLSPHSPHTVSEPALRALLSYAKTRDVPLSMHVAETKDEIRLLQRRKSGLDKLYAAANWDREWAPSGVSSFRYLGRLKALGPGFLVVHAVHATPDDIGILVRSGASVAHCARSNHRLHVGTMNLRAFLDARIPVGLGTDSLASAETLNLWDEMRSALKTHRAENISARDILHLATMGGAKAIGLEAEIGSLEAGKKADIIAIRLPKGASGDLYTDLLKETRACLMTMVNGRRLH